MGAGVYPGKALWNDPKFKVIHPDSGTSVPSPGVKPRSPASKVDSLLSEPLGKHINTGVGSLFPSPGDLPNPGIKPDVLQCRWILYWLSYQGSHNFV